MERQAHVERAPPPAALDFAFWGGLAQEGPAQRGHGAEKAPGRARLQPCRQSPARMQASAPEVRCLYPISPPRSLSFRHASEEESSFRWRSLQKLSYANPIVLHAKVCGRADSCRTNNRRERSRWPFPLVPSHFLESALRSLRLVEGACLRQLLRRLPVFR